MWEATPNYVQVAKHLKIPESTLRSWVNRKLKADKMPQGKEVPAEVYDMKKDDMLKVIQRLFGLHIAEAENTLAGASHHEVMGGIKILFDANQILTGGATDNQNRRIVIQYAE